MSHKYRAAIGRESPRPASRGITTQLEPRRRNRLRFRLPRPHKQRKRFFAPFVRLQKGLAAWHQAEGRCRLIGRHTCTASLAARPKPASTHAGARGHVLWPGRQSTQSAQFPGGKRDAPCGTPDAAESVERNPFLLMRPACASRLSPLTPAAETPPSPRQGFTRLPRCPPPKSSRRNPCTAARHTASPDRPG